MDPLSAVLFRVAFGALLALAAPFALDLLQRLWRRSSFASERRGRRAQPLPRPLSLLAIVIEALFAALIWTVEFTFSVILAVLSVFSFPCSD